MNPLIDKNFLKKLDQENQREVFVKIATLTFDENPIEFITGRATGGSINVDGDSSSRRSCSISLVAEELNIHDFYWGLNTKIEVFVGLKNNIDSKYPNIIWFPQGIYLITDFSTNQTTNNYTISISGRDKMSLLNGDIGGTINSLTADFGKIEEIDEEGNSVIKSLPIKDIIREVVHEYAREPFENIIIDDLDDVGLELLEYRDNENPLYMLREISSGDITNFFDNTGKNLEEYEWSLDEGKTWKTYNKNDEEFSLEDFQFETRTDFFDNSISPTYIRTKTNPETVYTIIKCTYGDTVGFRETDLTYAGELIGNIGSSITQSCLDPIKNMLGNFEYFYDIEGKFHFQRKRTFVDISWNNLITTDEKETYAESSALTSADAYSFENSVLITSFQNKPLLSNLKNDFSIWGTKKTTGGTEYPVHLRYAIDKKPTYYKNFNGEIFSTKKVSQAKLYDEAENQLQSLTQQKINYYKNRKKTPNGISEDWWEVNDWAELYADITGRDKNSLPTEYMRDYLKEWTQEDLVKYFPANKEHEEIPNWNKERNIYAFDVWKTADGNLNGPLKYTGHATGCSHKYTDFTNPNNNYYTYIYKPSFPDSEQAQIEITAIQEYIQKSNYNCDWREILYQMALDYLKYEHNPDFLSTLAKNNPTYYPSGYTGYEMYYTDIISFWRDIYNPEYDYTLRIAYTQRNDFEKDPTRYCFFEKVNAKQEDEEEIEPTPIRYDENKDYYMKNKYGEYEKVKITEDDFNENYGKYYILRDCQQGMKFSSKIDYYMKVTGDYCDQHFIAEIVEGINLNDSTTMPNKFKDSSIVCYDPTVKKYYYWDSGELKIKEIYLGSEKLINNPNFGWSIDIINNPQGINFWFDFLDGHDSSLCAYSVRNVGDRPKSINDSNVKSIYYRDIPNVIFFFSDMTDEEKMRQMSLKPGYNFINIPDVRRGQFILSTQKKCTKDVLEEWLYQYAHCTESITINSLPVYYLKPNTRIFIYDNNSGINGEYIINKISYQLTYNGMMNINATKTINRIY